MRDFVRGLPIQGPHESIRLFSICRAMKWNHLPAAGGIYDQNPKLLEDWSYIFTEVAEWEERESKRREQEAERKSRTRTGRRR